MTSLDESQTPKAQTTQTTAGIATPATADTSSLPGVTSLNGTSSLTGTPSVADMPSTTNEPSAAKPSSTTDEHFITLQPSIAGMTLDSAVQPPPTASTSPKWHQAAHAVLSTDELLCTIIAHLPLKDITAATGICRAWRNDVAADTTLQQAMFLKPVELSEVLVEDRILLALDDSELINIDRTTVVGQLHPFAQTICGSIRFRPAQSRGLPLPHNRWRGCSAETWSTFGHEHPGGTWREMFITQPPCVRVFVEIYELAKANSERSCRHLSWDEEFVQNVNGGFNLERDGGVKRSLTSIVYLRPQISSF